MRAGGKANLIIHHNMNCATSAIAAKRRKGKGFGNHALSSKSRITMKKNAKNLSSISITALLLFGSDTPNDNRINNFQMRRIWCHRQMHINLVKFAIGRRAHVIFHITRTTNIFGVGRVTKKFRHNRTKWLLQNIMKHI